MNYSTPLTNVLSKSIRLIGKSLIRDFSEIEKLQSSIKSSDKFVISSRENIKSNLFHSLNKIRPNLKISNVDIFADDDCWLVDYINGFNNFCRGIENFCISVSLKEKTKVSTSIFYNPIKDELFCFSKGEGGFKNDSRIRVSEKKKLNECIINFFKESDSNNNDIKINITNCLIKNSLNTRETGSLLLDLCDVAAGKIDCCIIINPSINILQIIKLIISESGGRLLESKKNASNIFYVSNKYIGKFVQEIIEDYYEEIKS